MTNTVIQMPNGNSPTLPRGRLVFACDATASRESTWTIARDLQAEMFRAAAPIGQLDMALLFYGGARCRISKWTSNGEQLAQLMGKIQCEAGRTQIERVLRHVLREHEKAPIQALTFIGDSFEEEIDVLSGLASELGQAGVPCFMFLEGRDPTAMRAFRLIALRSGGAFYEFNVNTKPAIDRLTEQLSGVARLAVGGQAYLTADKRG